ncbi:MAG: hypothetical protein P4L99_02350 [Chthoniobacter sp.]|nr:hypothetical protein [Chthoniobacter sp.]
MLRLPLVLLLTVGPLALGQTPVPVASPIPSPFTPSTQQVRPGIGSEALFVGKTWVSPAGTEYTFEPHGDGHTQEDAIKWHHIGGGIVQVDLPGKPKANTRYFKFVSPTEAYYNGDKKDITKPVHLK